MVRLTLLLCAATLAAGCAPAARYGPQKKDGPLGDCVTFVSRKHRAAYVAAVPQAAVTDLASHMLCETFQCRPDEWTRLEAVRPGALDDLFVFAYVENPWARALRHPGAPTQASCIQAGVDFIGRAEHLASDMRAILLRLGAPGRTSQAATRRGDVCKYPLPLPWVHTTGDRYADDVRAFGFAPPRAAMRATIFSIFRSPLFSGGV